jgi:hypothetical protein
MLEKEEFEGRKGMVVNFAEASHQQVEVELTR